mgnify:FL=1
MEKKTYVKTVDDFRKIDLEFFRYNGGEGPTVLFTAGLHGDEATGIYVAHKLIEYLDQNPLERGTVKILPVANQTAFRRMKRTSPYDKEDMNRIFPGNKEVGPTKTIAHYIWEEAEETDYIVDLHCCGVRGSSYTLTVWQEYGFAKELAEMIDIPQIVQSGGTRGQLFTEACAHDIPAVIIELPGGGERGVIDIEAGNKCYQALLNMLRQLEMLAGEGYQPDPLFCDQLELVVTDRNGAFVPLVEPGQLVEEGTTLGRIGEKEYTAPKDGVVIKVRDHSFLFKGTFLALIAPTLSE